MENPDDTGAPFGVALIGLGMVAKAHTRALQDLAPRVVLRGVFTRSAARRAAFLAEQAFAEPPALYASVEAVAADPAVDAAIVLTPPNARRAIVDTLSAAGKAILLEKPVERTSTAAEAIVAQCAARGVPLGVVFQHRLRAGARELARLMATGALGAPAVVEISVPWWRPQSYYDEPGRGSYDRDGGGVLIAQAIHTLDLVLSLTGPVAAVHAMAATSRLHRMESEDFVAAGLRFANGAVGSLVASTASFPGAPEGFTIHGDQASATLRGGELRVAWRDGRVDVTGEPAGTGGGADPMAFPHDWHRDAIADFADAVRMGRPPLVSGRDALRVHRLIDALVASSRDGCVTHLDEETRP